MTPGHGAALALAFPGPGDNCRPAVTYPFADPARVQTALQNSARTDIWLELRGLLKAGHAETIKLCRRQRGSEAAVSPERCRGIYCPQMGPAAADDAPSIAPGQTGEWGARKVGLVLRLHTQQHP